MKKKLISGHVMECSSRVDKNGKHIGFRCESKKYINGELVKDKD